jgi:hypothetical protein
MRLNEKPVADFFADFLPNFFVCAAPKRLSIRGGREIREKAQDQKKVTYSEILSPKKTVTMGILWDRGFEAECE